MLDRADRRVAATELGRERSRDDLVRARRDLHRLAEIGADEHDARVRARGMQRELHGGSAVEPHPCAGNLLRNRTLEQNDPPRSPATVRGWPRTSTGPIASGVPLADRRQPE